MGSPRSVSWRICFSELILNRIFRSRLQKNAHLAENPLAGIWPCRYIPLTQGSGRSSGVEHNLAKVRVGRSNRLARSKFLRFATANHTQGGRSQRGMGRSETHRSRHQQTQMLDASGRSSGVEHNLAKVRVGRSNRLARSNFQTAIRSKQWHAVRDCSDKTVPVRPRLHQSE